MNNKRKSLAFGLTRINHKTTRFRRVKFDTNVEAQFTQAQPVLDKHITI